MPVRNLPTRPPGRLSDEEDGDDGTSYHLSDNTDVRPDRDQPSRFKYEVARETDLPEDADDSANEVIFASAAERPRFVEDESEELARELSQRTDRESGRTCYHPKAHEAWPTPWHIRWRQTRRQRATPTSVPIWPKSGDWSTWCWTTSMRRRSPSRDCSRLPKTIFDRLSRDCTTPRTCKEIQSPVDVSRWRSAAIVRQPVACSDLANLEVSSLAFCTEVDSYGVITKFPQYHFRPDQEVLLYCELDNFVSESLRGGYETQLRGNYEIVDASGRRVVDRCCPKIPISAATSGEIFTSPIACIFPTM